MTVESTHRAQEAKWLPAALAAAAFLIYALIPTQNYYWDGVAFALTIEDAARTAGGNLSSLLHPNHLLYNVVGFAAYRLLGGAVRALYVLQFLNALFAAVAVYLVAAVVHHLTRSVRTALLLGSLFAFSGTWWRFSTDADAYILSVCLMTVCATILLAGRSPALAGAAHAVAMLTHQLAVFFFPAAVLLLWRTRRRRDVILYAAPAVVAPLGAYGLAFYFGEKQGRTFWGWLTSHAHDVTFSFDITRNTLISLRGWGQLFVAGRPSRVHYGEPGTIVLLLLLGLCGGLCVAALRKGRVRLNLGIHRPDLFAFSATWVAAYAGFLWFWLPHNTFYKLFALPGVILLIVSLWPPDRRPGPAGTWFACVLSLFNLTFAVIPYSRSDANAAVQFALDLQAHLEPGTIVHYADSGPAAGILDFLDATPPDDWFARYFNPQSHWVPAFSTGPIDDELRSGRSVWLETTSIDSFMRTQPEWLASRTREATWVQLVNRRQHIRFVRLRSGL